MSISNAVSLPKMPRVPGFGLQCCCNRSCETNVVSALASLGIFVALGQVGLNLITGGPALSSYASIIVISTLCCARAAIWKWGDISKIEHAAETALEQHQNEIERLSGILHAVQDAREQAEQQMRQAGEATARLDGSLQDPLRESANIYAQCQKLQEENASLQTQISAFENEKRDLISQIAILTQRLERFDVDIASESRAAALVIQASEHVEQDFNPLREQINVLTEQLRAKDASLTALVEEHRALREAAAVTESGVLQMREQLVRLHKLVEDVTRHLQGDERV